MRTEELREELNKRLTLNWLIQGAAQHAGMTFHHLVRDELNALDRRLVRLYDQYALVNLLQWWHADAALMMGWPPRFWRRAASKRSHPFFAHPLLSRFGGMLAAAGRQRALERCREKGVTRLPVLFALQAAWRIARLSMLEAPHRPALIELAKKSASMVWGIPIDRLDGDLVRKAFPGELIKARSLRGKILLGAVTGYGGVERRGDSLVVFARGTNWQLLTKELVKGTAELICLHGLNTLSDTEYVCVMNTTDRVELEPWMLQTGGELWRRVLELLPPGQPVAHVLMHLARLRPKALECQVLAVLEQPDWARELLAALGEDARA